MDAEYIGIHFLWGMLYSLNGRQVNEIILNQTEVQGALKNLRQVELTR